MSRKASRKNAKVNRMRPLAGLLATGLTAGLGGVALHAQSQLESKS